MASQHPPLLSLDYDPPNPPLSDALLVAVEAMLGVSLPEAFVAMMRHRNGGYCSERLCPVRCAVPEAFVRYVDDGYVSVSSFFGISTEKKRGSLGCSSYMASEWTLPAGLVLLDGDGHVWIALDYRHTKTDPSVVLAVADLPDVLQLAPSFDAFVRALVPFERVYDEHGDLRDG